MIVRKHICLIWLSLTLINAESKHIVKRSVDVFRCQPGDDPMVSQSVLDIFFTSSSQTFTSNVEKTFDMLDANHDGILELSEVRNVTAKIATADAAYNMTELNVPRLTDANGDGNVTRAEFLTQNQVFANKTFQSCSGFCNAVSTKLSTCDPQMNDDLQQKGRYMLTICKLGHAAFTDFGRCIKTVDCAFITDCFHGKKKNTHCANGLSKCKSHSGYYLKNSNFATLLDRMSNGTGLISTKSKDVGSFQYWKNFFVSQLVWAVPIAMFGAIMFEIMIALEWAPMMAFMRLLLRLPEGSEAALRNENNFWNVATFFATVLGSSVLYWHVIHSENYLGVSGPS